MGKSEVTRTQETAPPTVDELVKELKSKQDALDKLEPAYRAAVQAHSKAIQDLNRVLSGAGVRSRVVAQGASVPVNRRPMPAQMSKLVEAQPKTEDPKSK